MPTVWTKRAETDLYNLVGFIFEQSPQNASEQLERILTFADTLEQFPYKYRKDPNYYLENVRVATLPPYKITYETQGQTIRILRVLHAKQNPSS